MDAQLYQRIRQAHDQYRTASNDLDATRWVFEATHRRLGELVDADMDEATWQEADRRCHLVLSMLTRATEDATNRHRNAEADLAAAIAEVDDLDELEQVARETGLQIGHKIAVERARRAGALD
jgi:hypothetical protein